MKLSLITIFIATFSIILSSCELEEVVPQTTPSPVVIEVDRGFVESLRQTFAGQDIFFFERSQTIAGANGIVEYTVHQPENYDGTDLIEVSLAVTGGSNAQFDALIYGLMVDLNNKAVADIVNIQLDGQSMTPTNLLIMLSDL